MRNPFLRTSVRLALCMMMMITTAGSALAADNGADSQPAEQNFSIGNDDNALEVGVWYVQDYQNCGGWGLGDLPSTKPDALGLRNKLVDKYWLDLGFIKFEYPTPQWTAPIVWGNNNAWEEDWKRAAAGGGEQNQMDRVDLAYFSGHGFNDGFFFGVGGNTHDDCYTSSADAAYSWGNNDNDWVGIAACNILDDPSTSYRNWARAMYGTRLLMSMKTVMSDVDFGVPLGDSIRWGHSFTYAWFKAADQKLPGWQIARILAERNDYFNDRWYNHDDLTDYDSTYHIWTHQVGQNNLPPSVNAAGAAPEFTYAQTAGEMQVVPLRALSLAESEAQFGSIKSAFGLTDTGLISGTVAASGLEALNAVNNVGYSSDGDLIMDNSAGNFHYGNSDVLWKEGAAIQAAGAQEMMAIDSDVAKGIANSFLLQNNLMAQGAAFAQVSEDLMLDVVDPGRQEGVSAASIDAVTVATHTVNYQVVYTRKISVEVPGVVNAAGQTAMQEIEVVGPGAKLMVYVAPSVPTSATASAAMDNTVMGAMGGYRQIGQNALAANADQPLATPVLDPAVIEKVFQKLESTVALNYVNIPAVTKQVLSNKLSYWEGPIGWSQSQLIPVYVLNVKATLGDNSTQTYDVYIPVNASYMAPYAEIKEPTSALLPGSQITLEAADASKSLKANGVDDTLDIVLGAGDTYTYDWYLGEVKDANKIGSGRSIQYTIASVDAGDKQSSLDIVLVVTDASSSQGSGNKSLDTLSLSYSSVYLPTVQK